MNFLLIFLIILYWLGPRSNVWPTWYEVVYSCSPNFDLLSGIWVSFEQIEVLVKIDVTAEVWAIEKLSFV